MSTFTPPPPTQTDLIANRFYELCSKNQWDQAMSELYADDAAHVEAMEPPDASCKRITKGKTELLAMSKKWNETTTVHSSTCTKPRVNGDQFIVEMTIDCTHTEGFMAGKRITMSEYCLYTVKNGKIAEAKFFYGFGC